MIDGIKMNNRQQKLEKTKQYFLKNFVEDSLDGTDFDCDFLDAINELIERFADKSVDKKRYGVGDIFVSLDKNGKEWELVSARSLSGWNLRFVCVHSLNWRDEGSSECMEVDVPGSSNKSFTVSQEEFERATKEYDIHFLPKDIAEKEYRKKEREVKCDCSSSSYDVACCLCGETGFYKQNSYEKIKGLKDD